MTSMLGPELAKDVGCRADLVWRCDLASAQQAPTFVRCATSRGFEAVPGATRLGVAVFEEPDTRHRVVVVLRTGRVQVRLDALTPRETRVEEAHRMFERLQEVTP